jgi:DNA helicase II / ATP-dependent DNA helicase PcrA
MKQEALVRADTNARFNELYTQLNAEQRAAVDTIEGTVMVLAGPGTGKTQLLAMRIAAILQRTQMDPWNILCLTFTESGVAAMRERLLSIMGEAAYYVRIHTFHSFCNDIIQEHQELFSVGGEWRPLSDIERVELFESLVDKLPGTSPLKVFGQPYLYLRDISGHVQSLKQEHISPAKLRSVLTHIQQFVAAVEEPAEQFFGLKPKERTEARCADITTHLLAAAKAAELPDSVQGVLQAAWQDFEGAHAAAEDKRGAGKARTAYKNQLKRWLAKMARATRTSEALATVYEQYEQHLVKEGRYDYEDMINQVIEAFGEHDDLLAQYQEQFQYILVDEYQDTNGAQNEVVRLLGSFDDAPNIFVVGDDKQSIYRFQGASLANMLDFYERYRDHVAVISLRDNYRSQPVILAAADGVITHNEESLPKYIPGVTMALTAQAGRLPEPILINEAPSADVEDYQVAKRIEEMLAAGVAPREIAIIVRYHRDSQGVFS